MTSLDAVLAGMPGVDGDAPTITERLRALKASTPCPCNWDESFAARCRDVPCGCRTCKHAPGKRLRVVADEDQKRS